MTGREWKPGDVGLTAKGRLALRRPHDPDGWIDSHGAPWSTGRFPANVRPLVVIDPEDREAVQRLRGGILDAFRKHDEAHGGLDDPCPADLMQAALREFADPKPPKPGEPSGLGAVVEDAEGCKWVRVFEARAGDAGRDVRWASGALRESWGNVAAVRVLSEGVTP